MLGIYLIFMAGAAIAGIAARPVHSKFASAMIGGMIGGIVWWLIFISLAAVLRRRSAPNRNP